MKDVDLMTLVAGKGILGNTRYYNTVNKKTKKPNINHVSLIEREQINNHAVAVSIEKIDPGIVRSNIETSGIDLVSLVGKYILIGETAVLYFYKTRIPCWKMDVICDGLQNLMKSKRQGVIAEIIISGNIKIGDTLQIISIEEVNVRKLSNLNLN
jgi:MOSC domain-containing protein YiiM